MSFIDDLVAKFRQGNLAIKLIFINVAIFILISILPYIFNLDLSSWLGLESSFSDFVKKPWTVFTYIFVHYKFWHLFFNMLMLYIIGQFFYRYFDDKAFSKFYFLGGICGGLLFMISYLLLGKNGNLSGASAAIYSVLFAMVAYQPNLMVNLFFFNRPVKILHVAIGFIALGFLLNGENLGGNISHVGGALFGYFYMKQFEKGKSILGNLGSNLKSVKTKTSTVTQNEPPPKNDYDYNSWKKNKEDRTNQIIEKISRSGYNSLTAEEKEFLFKQGKNSG